VPLADDAEARFWSSYAVGTIVREVAVEVRDARPDDAVAIAGVHVSAWRAAYDRLLPSDVLSALSVERRAAHWERQLVAGTSQVWVATEPDVQGFVSVGDSRDEDSPDAGELYAIYVSPGRWGEGIGQHLLTASSTWLSSRYSAAHLWVLAGNSRACRFYSQHGWRPDGAEKQEQRGDVTLHEVRYAAQFHRT
jgi:GNAT superfamily N-acetyltransferase